MNMYELVNSEQELLEDTRCDKGKLCFRLQPIIPVVHMCAGDFLLT